MANELNVYDQSSKIDTKVCHKLTKYSWCWRPWLSKRSPPYCFLSKKSIDNNNSTVEQCSYNTCFESQAIRCWSSLCRLQSTGYHNSHWRHLSQRCTVHTVSVAGLVLSWYELAQDTPSQSDQTTVHLLSKWCIYATRRQNDSKNGNSALSINAVTPFIWLIKNIAAAKKLLCQHWMLLAFATWCNKYMYKNNSLFSLRTQLKAANSEHL